MLCLKASLRNFIFACLSSILLIACGDNNTPVVQGSSPGSEAQAENTLTGSVIKGPVDGAVVIVYEFDGITEIARGETDASGNFSISIGDNAGGVLISASGGTYTDEATGAENIQFGSVEMRAAYTIPESMTAPFDVTINVTPFTELAVREAQVDGVIDPQVLAELNTDFFDLDEGAINILTTLPSNALTDSLSEDSLEDLYGLYLAMFSQIISDQGFGTWDEAADLLEMAENDESILSNALSNLADSVNAAGANITLDLAQSALDALGISLIIGDDNGGSDGGSDGGSGSDGPDGSDSEAAAGLELLQIYAGTYDVSATTGMHMRGTVTISADGSSIDFDEGISLSVDSSNVFNRIPNFPDEPRVQIEFPGNTQQRIRIFVDPNNTDTATMITYDNDANDAVEPTVAVDITGMRADDSASGSVMPCSVGEASETTVPSGLAGTAGDLTLTFVPAGSDLVEGTVTNFTFSSSGLLFVDNMQVGAQPYLCAGNTAEINWYDEASDRLYAPSFKQDGTFNELNVASVANGIMFLGQYTDENGDFANVTNISGDSGGSSGGVDGGSSGTGDFTLTITGNVSVTTSGISVTTAIPTITIENIAAPNPDADFKAILEESDFNVIGDVTVTVINNTADRVTFELAFNGLNEGVESTYDLTYDYQR